MSEREEFEKWASDNGYSPRAIDTNMLGDYMLMQTQVFWTAWQACAILKDSDIAKLRDELLKQKPVAYCYPTTDPHNAILRRVQLRGYKPLYAKPMPPAIPEVSDARRQTVVEQGI